MICQYVTRVEFRNVTMVRALRNPLTEEIGGPYLLDRSYWIMKTITAENIFIRITRIFPSLAAGTAYGCQCFSRNFLDGDGNEKMAKNRSYEHDNGWAPEFKNFVHSLAILCKTTM